MIVGRPKAHRCLHCENPATLKGKCAGCWTKSNTNSKRKREGRPYEPLPILPREHAGRTPPPRPQEPTPMEPVSVTMMDGIRVTKCPPNMDAEMVSRGLGRIAALRRAEREWRG